MQLMMFDTTEASNPQSSCGKTSPGYLARMTTPSVVFSRGLPVNQSQSTHLTDDGQPLVLYALGNSWAVSVVRWIGRRIVEVVP